MEEGASIFSLLKYLASVERIFFSAAGRFYTEDHSLSTSALINTKIAGCTSPFSFVLVSSYALKMGVSTQSERVYPLKPVALQWASSYRR